MEETDPTISLSTCCDRRIANSGVWIFVIIGSLGMPFSMYIAFSSRPGGSLFAWEIPASASSYPANQPINQQRALNVRQVHSWSMGHGGPCLPVVASTSRGSRWHKCECGNWILDLFVNGRRCVWLLLLLTAPACFQSLTSPRNDNKGYGT